jgi:small-conductance mechanosensitive channel
LNTIVRDGNVAAMQIDSLLFASYFSEMSDLTRSLVTAGAILAGSILIGLILERLLVRGMRKLALSTEGKIDDVIAAGIKGVARWGFVLIGIYYALPFLPLPESLDDRITTGFRLAVLVLAIVVVSRFAGGIAAHYAHRLFPSSVSLAKVVVNAIVMVIGLLVIFQTMGIQIAPMIAALGVGGLAVALALKDTLANFFAGLQILASKQIRPGDYIRLDGGQEGHVYDISWRTTTLKVPRNNYIIVPNTILAQAIVSNFTVSERELGMAITVGVGYTANLARVERIAIETAREVTGRVEGSVRHFEPQVRFHTFADASIKLDVIVRTREFTDQGELRHELVKAIQDRFMKEGIEMPHPIWVAPPPAPPES